MAGGEILQRRPNDPEEIVAAVLIKFVVLDRDDGVDQIARQLVVGNGLAILDIDLAKDLSFRSRMTLADSICSSCERSRAAACLPD